MSTQNLLLIVLAAVLIFWALGAHNRLVRLSNAVAEQYPPVDAQLRQRDRLLQQWLALAERLPAEQRAPLVQALQAQRTAQDALLRRPSSAHAMSQFVEAWAQGDRAISALLPAVDRAAATDPLWHQTRLALLGLDEQLEQQALAYRSAVQAFNEAVAEFPALLIARLVGLKPLPDLITVLTERGSVDPA